jgi:MOSC domain-containing protein YiiM
MDENEVQKGSVMNTGYVYSISISPERGQLKKEILDANIIDGFGIEGDGHGGDWGRQITCLSWNHVQETCKAYHINAGPGDFAENLLINGLDLSTAKIGNKIHISDHVILEVTQIGKEDHPSVVSKTFGVSLLPREGLFCRVTHGGRIKKGDPVYLEL